ncbi:MAG: hypothetical protein GWN47_07030 [Woeseiaceae bacterium]|nr:hypothetical protein [Woeseiaceae bacterium]
MYDWLGDASGASVQVVTASRRLARVLAAEYGDRQLAAGLRAWPTPAIHSWQDWLGRLLADASGQDQLPARINSHQSQVLWDRCLRREVSDPLVSIPLLVRQSRQAWARLREFQVSLEDCRDAARGRDQHVFAAAAASYTSILETERWVDDPGLADLVADLVRERRIDLPDEIVVAGFDRLVPQVAAVLKSLDQAGTRVHRVSVSSEARGTALKAYANSDAELRSAGRWARNALLQDPDQRIAVVVSNLEQDADRCARLLREGLVPGWQYGAEQHAAAVNVSYGRKLSQYPMIAIALVLLRWLHTDLSMREISLLLRTPLAGGAGTAVRSRLELELRQLPDRRWSPSMLYRALERFGDGAELSAWLECLQKFGSKQAELPRRASPSEWALLAHDTLAEFDWPGAGTLDSRDFQLVNSWRELLNDFARLDLVSSGMSAGEAMSGLAGMAGDTVFQPEAEGAVIDVLGPLEAAGMEFDKVWVCGLSATNWPPPGHPLALVSRQLQRQHGMPDADPQDTLDYAARVLARLMASAPEHVCSYAMTDGDAQQTGTGLLARQAEQVADPAEDPGWHAARAVELARAVISGSDPVPAVAQDEKIAGGTSSLQRQLDEPFAAFARGRLGIRPIPGIVAGLSPSVRGNLIHDALQRLYRDGPTQAELAAWQGNELQERVTDAVNGAFARYRWHADPVLSAILDLESRRVSKLLFGVLELDRSRHPFTVDDTETPRELTIDKLRLRLRADRIDRLDSGELVILDYKTGQRRQFLSRDGMPKDLQLVVYAFAVDEPVSDLGLFNIDSRNIEIVGAGKSLTPDLDWNSALRDWRRQVEIAAEEMSRGDIRVNSYQSRQAARPLALLSRFAELRRDG